MQMVVRNNQATTARFSYQFYKLKPTSSPSTHPPTNCTPTTQPPTTQPPTTQLPTNRTPTTHPTNIEANHTTRPTGTVTGTFSAINQPSGEQWVDHYV